jgi:hypothetical protein
LTPDCDKVVHGGPSGHGGVTKTLDFSGNSPALQILFNEFNMLKNRLKNRQYRERGEKQGKISPAKKFPAELSTKRVDSFALALGLAPLQPRVGIDDSEIKV